MRPIEILLSIANLLAFIASAAPLPPAMRWLRLLAPVALLAAGAQVLVEGPRWQMVPAYVLAGLFFLVWLLQRAAPAVGLTPHRWIGWLSAGLGTLMLVISVALPIIIPVFRFPPPGGPYKIGTLTYHWVDEDRAEIYTAHAGDRRELMVQLWYPAKGDPSARRAPYVTNASALSSMPRLINLPGFILGHFEHITTNAIPSAPVADRESSYPVLIFSTGRGGYRTSNTLQVEELVSHGYIVAAIDHPGAVAGVTFPDGRVMTLDPRMFDPDHPGHPEFFEVAIPFLAQDVIFTLDQLTVLNQSDPNGILTGRLELQRVGMFGVSLGGAIAAEACWMEPRLKACLAMDVFIPEDAVESGLQQPTMLMTRDAQTMQLERWAQADIDETQTTMRAVFEKLSGDGYLVRVPGMFHNDFSDASLLFPFGSAMGLTGRIAGERVRSILKAYSLAFFDRHLKGLPAPLLDEPSAEYPEVFLEARRP